MTGCVCAGAFISLVGSLLSSCNAAGDAGDGEDGNAREVARLVGVALGIRWLCRDEEDVAPELRKSR